VDNVETTIVALTVSDNTNTTHVTTTSDHGNGASVELDEVGDLAGFQLNLDGVVDLDQRIRVADAAVENHVSGGSERGNIPAISSKLDRYNVGCRCVEGWFNQSLIQRLNDV